MKKITFCLLACLFLTACNIDVARRGPLTPVASVEPTSNATPESTPLPETPQLPTATPLPTALPPTPVPTVAPVVDAEGIEPAIVYFRAVVNGITYNADGGAVLVDPGDTIRFEWATRGDSTTLIIQSHTQGQARQELDRKTVNSTGSYVYQVQADDSECLLFSLHASSGDETQTASFTISLPCAHALFFSSEPPSGRGCDGLYDRTAAVCPGAPWGSDAAEQRFEHGTMIWVKQEKMIYVLFDNHDLLGVHWQVYPDNWSEDMADYDPGIVPPDGLYQPVRGFGLVWRENPGVREQIGWAIDQETAFATTMQSRSGFHYNQTYITALDGNVWYLIARHGGDTEWEKIEWVR